MKSRLIISATAIAFLTMAGPAFAQSTITGTLSGGASTTSSGTSTLSGTVTAPPGSGTLTGTVTSPSGGGTGGGGGGGGGGGTGSGSNVVDICPNIAGVQSTLSGYVLQNGLCIVASGGGGGTLPGGTGGGGGVVLGTSTDVPNVPNTGAGAEAPLTLLALAISALGAIWSIRYLRSTAA